MLSSAVATGEVVHWLCFDDDMDVSSLQRSRKLSWVKCNVAKISGLESLTILEVLHVSLLPFTSCRAVLFNYKQCIARMTG